MNLLLLKMGPMRFRGGGGGGGGGGDGGDSGGSSGESSSASDTGNVSDMGTLGDVSVSADAIGDDGDAGLGATLADMANNGNLAANSNGIAGQFGIENPTLAAAINHGLGMLGNMAVPGLGGIAVGMANSAINGNPASAAASIGNAIASAAGIPGIVGSIAGNAVGNMGGVPSSSVPGDPSGGGSRDWTASPTPIREGYGGSGTQAISGGLGMGSTGNAKVPGLSAISGVVNPALLNPVGRAGDVTVDNPLIAALRGASGGALRL